MRICVVDDHEVVREGLRCLLMSDAELSVVACAPSGAEALREIRRTLPDVVVTEFRLPDMSCEELCRRVRESFPSVSVVVQSASLSEDVVQRALSSGAAGFVTKAAGLAELRKLLGEVASGTHSSLLGGPGALVNRLHRSSGNASLGRRLTPRQERVLELTAQGLTYCEISRVLHVSESTVRFHVQKLKARLGARTRTQLVAVAIHDGLIASEGLVAAR
ncbi:MAG: response regulator transcription factor [Sciscionella sp.]